MPPPSERCKNAENFGDLPTSRLSFNTKGGKKTLGQPGGKVKGIEIAILNGDCHCYVVENGGVLRLVGKEKSIRKAKEVLAKAKGLNGTGSKNWIMCVDGKRITEDFPPLPITANSTDTSNGKKGKMLPGRKQITNVGTLGNDMAEVSGGSTISPELSQYITKALTWVDEISGQIEAKDSNIGTPDIYNYNDSCS